MSLCEMFRLPSWFMAGLVGFVFDWVACTDVSSPGLDPLLRPGCDLIVREVAVVAKWWREGWRRQLRQT